MIFIIILPHDKYKELINFLYQKVCFHKKKGSHTQIQLKWGVQSLGECAFYQHSPKHMPQFPPKTCAPFLTREHTLWYLFFQISYLLFLPQDLINKNHTPPRHSSKRKTRYLVSLTLLVKWCGVYIMLLKYHLFLVNRVRCHH